MLIIVLVLIFAWSTAYYDNALKNASMQYNKNLEKLQEATGNVIVEKVNETIQLKDNYQKDKEALEKGYFDLKTENEELKAEKDKLQTELNSVKGDLEIQKSRFDILYNQFQQVQNSLISANEQISKLAARINELCSKLKASGGTDEKC